MIIRKSTNSRSLPLVFFCANMELAYFEYGSVVVMPYLWSNDNSTNMVSFRLTGVGRFRLYAGESSFGVNLTVNPSFIPISKRCRANMSWNSTSSDSIRLISFCWSIESFQSKLLRSLRRDFSGRPCCSPDCCKSWLHWSFWLWYRLWIRHLRTPLASLVPATLRKSRKPSLVYLKSTRNFLKLFILNQKPMIKLNLWATNSSHYEMFTKDWPMSKVLIGAFSRHWKTFFVLVIMSCALATNHFFLEKRSILVLILFRLFFHVSMRAWSHMVLLRVLCIVFISLLASRLSYNSMYRSLFCVLIPKSLIPESLRVVLEE